MTGPFAGVGTEDDPRFQKKLKERKRKRARHDEPVDLVDGSPNGAREVRIQSIYDHLREEGHDEAADRLNTEPDDIQAQQDLATELLREHDPDAFRS